MKKMLLRYWCWPCLLQDVLNRRLLFKQTGRKSKETITHHFFVSGLGRRKNCRCSQTVAAQKMLVKTETQQISVNGLLGFITLGIYTPPGYVYCLLILYELPIDMGNLHSHCSLIYFCSFQLFLHSDHFSEVK